MIILGSSGIKLLLRMSKNRICLVRVSRYKNGQKNGYPSIMDGPFFGSVGLKVIKTHHFTVTEGPLTYWTDSRGSAAAAAGMARPNPSVSNCGLVIVQVQPDPVQQRHPNFTGLAEL